MSVIRRRFSQPRSLAINVRFWHTDGRMVPTIAVRAEKRHDSLTCGNASRMSFGGRTRSHTARPFWSVRGLSARPS